MSDHHNERQSPPPQPPPVCTVDPYTHLRLTRNPDGTLTRHSQLPTVPADGSGSGPVLSKDIPLDPTLNTWLRLYLPKSAANSPASKLPVVLYFHGGGFIILSADTAIIDGFCSALADHAAALVVSLEYRLAPEHRLPAAYDDAESALAWLAGESHREEWLRRHGDLSRVFLLGESAGANMIYHLASRVATGRVSGSLGPVKIRGLVMLNPFFGGSGRTGSECRLANDPILPLSVMDLMWELALPEGAGRDHEYCWVRAGGSESGGLERFREMGWRVMVTGCGGDPLFDRQVEVARLLEEKGVEVVAHFGEGGYHIMEFFEPAKATPLLVAVKGFMESSCCN